MRHSCLVAFSNIQTWKSCKLQGICVISGRSKVSDCFSEVYKWKNVGNQPLGAESSESDRKNEVAKANLTLETVQHLERLSLVDFSNEAAVIRLSSAIRYADRLKDINSTDVEPLFSLLENESLLLRDDEITEGNQKHDVLRNASVVFEDFYVAPPGNIPLEQQNAGNYGGILERNNATSSSNLDDESSTELKKARRKMKK